MMWRNKTAFMIFQWFRIFHCIHWMVCEPQLPKTTGYWQVPEVEPGVLWDGWTLVANIVDFELWTSMFWGTNTNCIVSYKSWIPNYIPKRFTTLLEFQVLECNFDVQRHFLPESLKQTHHRVAPTLHQSQHQHAQCMQSQAKTPEAQLD